MVGINKIGCVAKTVATFLKLDKPEQYTGHCFRRSSATILADAGADITTLKRHGGWKSSAVAEGYVDDSATNRMSIANKIMGAVASSSNQNTSEDSSFFLHPEKESAQQEPSAYNTHPKENPSQSFAVGTSSQTVLNVQDIIENHLTSSLMQTPLNFINCQGNHFTFNFYTVPEQK